LGIFLSSGCHYFTQRYRLGGQMLRLLMLYNPEWQLCWHSTLYRPLLPILDICWHLVSSWSLLKSGEKGKVMVSLHTIQDLISKWIFNLILGNALIGKPLHSTQPSFVSLGDLKDFQSAGCSMRNSYGRHPTLSGVSCYWSFLSPHHCMSPFDWQVYGIITWLVEGVISCRHAVTWGCSFILFFSQIERFNMCLQFGTSDTSKLSRSVSLFPSWLFWSSFCSSNYLLLLCLMCLLWGTLVFSF